MSVFIVNFGHAQMIEDARSYVGTRGFTDPEVVADEEAHSTTSETFGKMLEHVAKAAGDTVIINYFRPCERGGGRALDAIGSLISSLKPALAGQQAPALGARTCFFPGVVEGGTTTLWRLPRCHSENCLATPR